ncbi:MULTISPECIES: MIP/aquaporin family protein [unclassified Gardnerella]|uniref:MIP/aquaporin family protein n=1 Tax=unclassified Gardnerella TaxID=2628112 RepID=UPI000E69C179|nr:hypothetical protein CJI57_04015 [Bifidobacteriaceae bacterium WP012]
MIEAPETTSEEAKSDSPLAIKIATEFIATALLMFTIYTFYSLSTAMYGINLLMIAVGTGVAYAAAISIASKVSGGQLNPAVTIASMFTGRTSYLEGPCYIIAQVLGSILAAGAFVFILPQTKMVKDANWFAPVVNGFEQGSISATQLKSVNSSFGVITALLVEVIAVAIIVATAMNYTKDNGKTNCGYSTHMGIAYAAATLITYQITGSGLNPARSTGIAIFANFKELEVKPLTQLWVFWIAPIFAAALVGFIILLTKLLAVSEDKTLAGFENDTNALYQKHHSLSNIEEPDAKYSEHEINIDFDKTAAEANQNN